MSEISRVRAFVYVAGTQENYNERLSVFCKNAVNL